MVENILHHLPLRFEKLLLLAQLSGLIHQCHDLSDFGSEMLFLYRLEEIAEDLMLHRLQHVVTVAVGGGEDDIALRVYLSDLSEHRDTVHLRHADITDDDIRARLAIALQSLSAVCSQRDTAGDTLQRSGIPFTDSRLILDIEDRNVVGIVGCSSICFCMHDIPLS